MQTLLLFTLALIAIPVTRGFLSRTEKLHRVRLNPPLKPTRILNSGGPIHDVSPPEAENIIDLVPVTAEILKATGRLRRELEGEERIFRGRYLIHPPLIVWVSEESEELEAGSHYALHYDEAGAEAGCLELESDENWWNLNNFLMDTHQTEND